MKALFVHSHKFKKYQNRYYSEGQFSYLIWEERYLRYFDKLYVASRCVVTEEVNEVNLSSGKKVEHIELPDITTLKNSFLKRKKVFKLLSQVIADENIDVVIARLPSRYGLIAIEVAEKFKKKIVVEMVGDPFDALWNHGTLKGKLMAPLSYFQHVKKFKNLDNIIFVTESYLQERYKKNFKNYHTTNVSNVNISLENNVSDLNSNISINLSEKPIINIALIGSYSAKYKGIDTAIRVISILKSKYNIIAHLHIVGSGNKERYTNLINKLKVKSQIHFIGNVKGGKNILNWLSQNDFYIQPSLTEGLPRGLIEAMSRGLPAIATRVGGIPELLKEEALVKVNDAEGIAEKLYIMINNKDLYNQHANYNFYKAKYYDKSNLQAKRDSFYKKILED